MSHQKEITYRNPIVIDRDWRKLKVSVIVPVYNVKPYLNRCVKTLLAQTLDNIEIILVDDCSTDGSGEVIKQLVIKHPDVVKAVFLEINSKQGAARNEGIKIARGEYISFVDSDDWVSTDMLKLLYEKAKETGADLVDC
ncbi:TPA: glycosyltransferase family 2 protein, partial [Escherichia coli]|nr:glycosyltransferase family 2 protein [Escherichia coli]